MCQRLRALLGTALPLLALTGCFDSVVPTRPIAQTAPPSAGADPAPASAPSPPDGGTAASGSNCIPPQPLETLHHPTDDGFDFGSGAPCSQACHAPGQPHITPDFPLYIPAARKFTFSGTIYDAPRNGRPLPQATVTLTDSKGVRVTMVSKQSGSFWSQAATPLTPPIHVEVSECPDTRVMHRPLTTPSASCNNAGCHGFNDDRIFLVVPGDRPAQKWEP